MTTTEKNPSAAHLTDDALFALAVPTAGVPEALPRHLMECLACSRALTEWKSAVRELGENDVEELEARSPEEWSAAEEATLAAVRRSGAPGRGRPHVIRWALPVAVVRGSATVSFVPPLVNTAEPDIDLIHERVQQAIERSQARGEGETVSAARKVRRPAGGAG